MNYDLCKKLKDAGFPFQSSYGADLDMWSDKFSIKIDEDVYLIPTTSELIEACGDRFHALEQKIVEGFEVEGGKWIAYSNEPNDLGVEAHIFKQGSTPEEAVANLYLELNKK